ncbi:MAG: hypothetical protein KAI17_26270, partial [Thiotrichaceae bacterium]|nr:hypothetical protein [Thiotrichaceae bacterium]
SKEHHQSLILAQKAIKISEDHNVEAITELCKAIVHDYPDEWMVHFKIEEDSIFQLFSESNKTEQTTEVANLCHILKQEHLAMNRYYEQMKDEDYSILGDFGRLLKKHTRTEERQLFPLLEKIMSKEELNRVYQLSQDYRKTD